MVAQVANVMLLVALWVMTPGAHGSMRGSVNKGKLRI